MAKARFQAAPPAAITPREKAYINALSAFFDPADGLPDEARVFDTAAAQQTEFRKSSQRVELAHAVEIGGGTDGGRLPVGRAASR